MSSIKSIPQFLKKLDIQYPIVGAPMANVSGGELAASVTSAGGFGFIGCGYSSPNWLRYQLDIAELYLERKKISRKINLSDNDGVGLLPIGIGFISWYLDQNPEQLDIALNSLPQVIWFSFGDYEKHLRKVKERNPNILIMVQVNTVKEAIKANELNVDIVVAQGIEAGGHGPLDGTSTISLLSEIANHYQNLSSSPYLLAAGGIADYRTLASAFTSSACGVVLGTLLTVANESLLSNQAKQIIIDTKDGSINTFRTTQVDKLRNLDWDLSKYSARILTNQFNDSQFQITKEIYDQAIKDKDYNIIPIFASSSIGLVNKLAPANNIINDLINDYYYNYIQQRRRWDWAPIPSPKL